MEITQKILNEAFEYNPDTGVLLWKVRPRSHFTKDRFHKATNVRFAGKEAGSYGKHKNKKIGYLSIRMLGKTLKVHRIAWMMVHGEWPAFTDHIDGDGLNNRLSNLRSVGASASMRNQSRRKDNTSGYPGVYWYKDRQYWCSRIRIDGKYKTVYNGPDLESAIAARKAAEKLHGYHPNHGRPCTV